MSVKELKKLFALRYVKEISRLGASQPILLHQYRRRIFETVLKQSLSGLGRNALSRD
jgi:hypothetical protein